MGFSVSGATAILFLGMFISFGVAYTAASNGFDQVHGAYEEDADEALARQNTDIAFDSTNVANQGGQLYLNTSVNNTGSEPLSVNDTDILIDGNYIKPTSNKMVTLEVNGNGDTDLWLPGETLRVEIAVGADPSRVKVVTGTGVAGTEVV
ncbi:fla cluster protein FlaF [Halorussus lipolyticus]|uniref:fla cluster protein FlaF n=1 Tax=Halorussus lipolyticus TaxID=3034024 RepID=UPI0023E7FF84|nr:fla cluster protein FlaF [Halorussus sp. DT80]